MPATTVFMSAAPVDQVGEHALQVLVGGRHLEEAHALGAGQAGEDPGEPAELGGPYLQAVAAELDAARGVVADERGGEPAVVAGADPEQVGPVGHEPADVAVV